MNTDRVMPPPEPSSYTPESTYRIVHNKYCHDEIYKCPLTVDIASFHSVVIVPPEKSEFSVGAKCWVDSCSRIAKSQEPVSWMTAPLVFPTKGKQFRQFLFSRPVWLCHDCYTGLVECNNTDTQFIHYHFKSDLQIVRTKRAIH